MTPEEQLRDFTILVSEMRDAQKEYFSTRDTAVLNKAKTKERRVDAAIAEYNRPETNQGKLFKY